MEITEITSLAYINSAVTFIGVTLMGYLLVRQRWLTKGGAIAMVIMATWIVFFINPMALILPLVFLVLGSLSSKLNKKVLFKSEKEGRTAKQVLANGLAAMIIAVPYFLTFEEQYLKIFTLVFATSLSDTLSSEIGRYFKGKTIDLRTLRLVSPGISGGISVLGTIAGLIGAFIATGIGFWLFGFSLISMMHITMLGFGGMLLDSFLGAFLQAKYMIHGMLLEEGRNDQLVYGYHWIDNSMVNFLSTSAILLTGLLVL